MDQPLNLLYGFADAHHEFKKKYGNFATKQANIKKVCDIASSNVSPSEEEDKRAADIVIFALGQMVRDDFLEIYVLCCNGQSTGGMKILRGMFERVVYVHYFERHPDQAQKLLDYYWVTVRKRTRAMEAAFPGHLSPTELAELEARYEAVKNQFETPVCDECRPMKCQTCNTVFECERCKKKIVNWSWSKVDLVSMAKEVGVDHKVLEFCYYQTLQETHPGAESIFRRIDLTQGTESLYFRQGALAGDMTNVLACANLLLLSSLEVLKKYFKVGTMEDPLRQCWEDYKELWVQPLQSES